MIELRNQYPKNREHFAKLLGLGKEIIAVCNDLGITPLLNGSLVVFGYTQDSNVKVHDIDLACAEREFPSLSRALTAKGLVCDVKKWHILQVGQGDLKVEFDAVEYRLDEYNHPRLTSPRLGRNCEWIEEATSAVEPIAPFLFGFDVRLRRERSVEREGWG